jgi:RimJ/RimL family protein N-acetyltransferase
LSDADLVRLAEVDFERHVSLVATLLDGGDERIVGVARYIRRDDEGAPTRAELAVTVADDHQGRGIASALLRRLAQIAHARGVKEFEADVLGDNGRMLRLLESSGFATRRSIESGVVHVILSTDATPG